MPFLVFTLLAWYDHALVWNLMLREVEFDSQQHINETEMFQMTSREPMEPIDEEVGVLGDLEDVLESEQTQDNADQTEEDKGDNPDQSASPVQPAVSDLLLD